IPSTVTNIEGGAFSDNLLPESHSFIYDRNPDGSENTSKLVSYGGIATENIVISNTVTIIDEYALSYSELKSVIIPNSVTTIEDFAFYYNQLTSITVPSSVTSLGSYAFYNNQLTNIIIPSSVISVGNYAFYNNQLISATLPNNVTLYTSSISQSFYDAYNPTKAAGTYTATSQTGTWTKQ
ncbi:MAG: leucine-rich repeat domain-containing protein, partial [Bacilli bacterium]|nr:leucine-rich repeat domain-containing protein [Bacilli bacterium]